MWRCAAPLAQATSYYWDTNGVTAGAGGATPTGTWSSGGTTWSTSSAGTAATSAVTTTTGDDLYFSAGTDATGTWICTLSSTENAGSLTFEEGSVTISGGTQLTFGNTGNGINTTTSGTTTISSVIGGSAGLTKNGSGKLVLTSGNSYTGGTILNTGQIDVGITGNNPLGTGTITLNGGTLRYYKVGSSGNTQSNNIVVNGTSTIQQDFGSDTFTMSGVFSGSGALTVTGSYGLILSNTASTYNGTLTLSGTLTDSANKRAPQNATLVMSGGTLNFSAAGLSATISNLQGTSGTITGYSSGGGKYTDCQQHHRHHVLGRHHGCRGRQKRGADESRSRHAFVARDIRDGARVRGVGGAVYNQVLLAPPPSSSSR